MEHSRVELISDTLRNLRRYHGHTQKYLAWRLGISQTAYSKMERGCIRVSEDHLNHIALMYGLLLSDLADKTSDEIIRMIINEKILPPQ
jgi:transcriptional regulator with XRE-family HTH domain